MVKGNYLTHFIVSVVIIVILGVFLLNDYGSQECEVCENCESCQELPEESALVTAYVNAWAENLYDSSELIFQVNVYNYGTIEAKNVEVICDIYDADEDGYLISELPISTFSKRIGNLASTSYDYNEIYGEKPARMNDNSIAVCKVSYCEQCEILDDRIPLEDRL